MNWLLNHKLILITKCKNFHQQLAFSIVVMTARNNEMSRAVLIGYTVKGGPKLVPHPGSCQSSFI